MTMHRKQRRRSNRLAMGVAATALLICSGCNPFALYQRRHTGYDFYMDHNTTYYHYPAGSWFVPAEQRHHCPVTTEQPFYGYQATCWRAWPEPWMPCPPPPGCDVIEGEPIDTPRHELTPTPVMPTPMPVAPPAADPDPAEKSSLVPSRVRSASKLPASRFYGAHGFSSSDTGAEGTSVAIDLTATKASHEEQPTLQQGVAAELEGLKKLVR